MVSSEQEFVLLLDSGKKPMRKWSDPVLGWICTHYGPAPFTAHSNLRVAGQPVNHLEHEI